MKIYKLPFGKFFVFYFTNGSLVIYISNIPRNTCGDMLFANADYFANSATFRVLYRERKKLSLAKIRGTLILNRLLCTWGF